MYLKFLQTGLLDQLSSSIVTVMYQRLAGADSTVTSVIGLSGLIRAGSGAALSSALSSAAQFGNNGTLVGSVRNDFRNPDPTSIAVLGKAASDSGLSVTMREAAAHALASIHTLDALPYLAALLDDSEAYLRVEAMAGLGAFANGLPIQTPANIPGMGYLQPQAVASYRTPDTVANLALGRETILRNENEYLSFWRSWPQ